MRAAALGMVLLCGIAFISGSDRSLGQQPKPKPQRTLENLIEEPVAEAPPAPESEAKVNVTAPGLVVAWGAGKTSTGIDPEYGQSIVPASLSGVTAVAAGVHYTMALKSDGTVVAWGQNDFGQTNIPSGLSNVTAIAVSRGYFSLALKSDGTVVAWGRNEQGQLNVPVGLSGVTAIAGGYRHGLALKSDGTVVAWGRK